MNFEWTERRRERNMCSNCKKCVLFETLPAVDCAMGLWVLCAHNANCYCVQKVRRSNRSIVTLEHVAFINKTAHDDQISRNVFFFSLLLKSFNSRWVGRNTLICKKIPYINDSRIDSENEQKNYCIILS